MNAAVITHLVALQAGTLIAENDLAKFCIADDRILSQAETPGLEKVWSKCTARRTSSPKLWMDAYLAAFAITAGAQLVTTDKAFTQFAGLDVKVLG